MGSYRVFTTRRDRSSSPRTGLAHDFYVIESNDWINVVPVTAEGDVVLVRQFRHGVRELVLEIPGGIVEPGEAPEHAARRELLEETGFASNRLESLGWIYPNPAIQENRCHLFVAHEVEKVAEPSLDETEEIEVIRLPLSQVEDMIERGELNHALVIVALARLFARLASRG